MTHPLTPHEKVELKPCPMCGMTDSDDNATQESGLHVQPFKSPAGGKACRVQCACGVSGPSAREDWQATSAWNRRTALASGSGDQLSGNPGILKSGDHAELARLAEAATPGEWELDGHQCLSAPDGTIVVDYSCCSRGEWEANAAYLRAVQPSRTLALLAENAALRAEVSQANANGASHWSRATEAERNLAEAVGLLRRIAETPSDQFDDVAEADKIRTFLSKEAERG